MHIMQRSLLVIATIQPNNCFYAKRLPITVETSGDSR